MPISTPAGTIKSELDALSTLQREEPMDDSEYNERLSIIIANAIGRATGTGTANGVTPGSGTAGVVI